MMAKRALAALLLLATPACGSPATPAAARPTAAIPAAPRCTPADRRAALDAMVAARRGAYTAAIAKARTFLDGLEVDPIKLRRFHIKGKKKLAEAIDVYHRLHQVAPPEERAKILARVTELARPTLDDRYHDLLTIDDRELKEDATSYLRAAVLLDRMGVDITRYRAEIKNVKWRLDAQMKDRGPHQRRAFHAYYQHFGLSEPFPLAGALDKGLIAARTDAAGLSRMDAYTFTHEIYAAYDFGERLDAEPFTEADHAYLDRALPQLLGTWLSKKDPDLVAEIMSCMRYVRGTSDPSYAAALGYLLEAQNADGSWGSYDAARARLGDLVKQALYLHTTMVVVEALTLGFEEMFRKGEGPVCG
ncbi:Hypothetical protein A7982_05427 [Minicystis rosea]|nr:Hypothetical protein A7982_05427 [Minicystis rosea]